MIKQFFVYNSKKVINLLNIDAKTLGIIDIHHIAMFLAKYLQLI
jgi:hypothetical protein